MTIAACRLVINVISLIIAIYFTSIKKIRVLVLVLSNRQKSMKFKNCCRPDVASMVFMCTQLGF